MFTNDIFVRYKPGEYYRVNSLLIQDYEIKPKYNKLNRLNHLISKFKYSLGNKIIILGNWVKFGKDTRKDVVYKNNYQWWLKK